jgi:subtilisin family serine protease
MTNRPFTSARLAARLVLVAAPLITLSACGGGGGGASSVGTQTTSIPEIPDTSASESQVLIEPSSPVELEQLCDRFGAEVVSKCDGTDYEVVRIPNGSSVEKFLSDIEHERSVRDAIPNSHIHLPEGTGSTIPAFVEDDPAAIATQPALARIGVLAAHARGLAGEGEIIAVIDTGFDVHNPRLDGHVLSGWDAIDEDDDPSDAGNRIDDNGNGLVDEGVGHGTFVASLIVAVAPRAKLVLIRALDSDSTGTASSVTNAISMAVSRGAKIINFSGGLDRDIRMIRQAIDIARFAGATVIAAAGNRGSASSGDIIFPARLDEVVAVTSVDLFDRKSDFASFGTAVDFCAPGEDLLGAHPMSPTGVARWSGTSFSTALVTGCFALVRSSGPRTLIPRDLIALLTDTAANVDSVNSRFTDKLGGRIDVDAAAVANGN